MAQTAVVTGACGFVGTHMVDLLVEKNYTVRATDLKNADKTYLSKDAEFVAADITNKDDVKKVLKDADLLFHVASVFDFYAPWHVLYKVNVLGTRNLCECAVEENIKCMVHWSSGAIYGIPKQLPSTEKSPIAPSNNYEKSKAEQEKVVFKFHTEHNLPVVIIRPAVIYGKRSKYGVSTAIFMLAKGQLPAIPGSGKNIGTYVHVADVVNSALFLVNKPFAIGEVYNIADDTHYSSEELLLHVADLLGIKIFPFHIPASIIKMLVKWSEWSVKGSAKKPKLERDAIAYLFNSYWLDNSKLKSTGYELIYPDIKVGLKEVIEWYRTAGWI
jgi:nucleoside-diphosphate-sugar epimerase